MVVAGMDDERRGDGEYLTEDVILELLTILVDPLLPAYDVDYVPSYPDQESVAMQVHATVVIYNYYLRRQLPELQFLDAERFCNLLGRLKPTLAPHFSKSSDHLSPTEKCMSLAEKKVAEACNISSALDASMAEPNITEWRITKVSIFLVDSLRKNCFLQFGSVFKGVWSIIEQEVDLSTGHVKVNINRRRQNHQGSKTAENCTTNDQYPDEATCRRLALGAVEAATGILESGVEVIQSGVVYSINKEKSAARVFFMQSTNPSKDGIFEVPIKDALASLSGPLMTKRARGWRHTRVVEFFHVIPYHRLLLEWTSRETPPGRELRDEHSGVKASDVVSNSFGNERNPSKCLINERSVISVDSQDLNDDVHACVQYISSRYEGQSKVPDITENKIEEKSSAFATKQVSGAETNAWNVELTDETPESDTAPIFTAKDFPTNIQIEEMDILHDLIVTKGSKISDAAMNILKRKRDILYIQRRELEDEMAQCAKDMATIASGANSWKLKIQTLVEWCSSPHFGRNVMGTYDYSFGKQILPPSSIRIETFSTSGTNQVPCQILDSLCVENDWVLPTYQVNVRDGEFQAQVTVQGINVKYEVDGELRESPYAARQHAAEKMLTKMAESKVT